jgi:non-homologous end joining protein Ku
VPVQDFQVNKPQAYEEMVPETEAEPEEVEMARKLIEASAAKGFDLTAYPDMYTMRLTELVEEKVAGKEIVGAAGISVRAGTSRTSARPRGRR